MLLVFAVTLIAVRPKEGDARPKTITTKGIAVDASPIHDRCPDSDRPCEPWSECVRCYARVTLGPHGDEYVTDNAGQVHCADCWEGKTDEH